MRSQEEKAKEWMETQEASPRPGSTFKSAYIPKGVTLNPIVKMVPPSSLKPNPKNDFDPLSEEEYANLKENIALNGILDALTAKKDGTLITGENRYRIALELKDHEDEAVRRRVENVPVRYYMNELTLDEEYDILEGDNLFRRHLTAEQRKERLKRRILRKYKDDLLQDNRGGDRKSESSKISSESAKEENSKDEREDLKESFPRELGLLPEVGTVEEQEKESKYQGDILIEEEQKDEAFSLLGSDSEKSKVQGEPLIGSNHNLSKKISEGENIPVGTAKRYIAEIRKELQSKDPKPAKKKVEKKKETLTKKDKVKEFQKKYSKLSSSEKKTEVSRLVGKLALIRKKREKLETQVTAFLKEDSEIVEKLASVGEKKRVLGL
ncbi:ParB N-terminal domain-containing protein [Leptospira interrogans]|uniref:ParB N-terminal domain-containing protein n=1 Tax=Leptospira interrogans TaxID=173 RepID=UPI000773F3A4|nr:ParB N-terminal domain-containing protein [Leptospira interrogans]